MNTREIVLTAVFSALYATLVISLSPISFGPLQLRIADTIIPLTIVFGWPVVAGVTLGCFVGARAACSVAPIPIGLIVGGYLWAFFSSPEILALPS